MAASWTAAQIQRMLASHPMIGGLLQDSVECVFSADHCDVNAEQVTHQTAANFSSASEAVRMLAKEPASASVSTLSRPGSSPAMQSCHDESKSLKDIQAA